MRARRRATSFHRALAASVAFLALSPLPATARALPVLGHEGRWLTDPQGRVVILHGVQEWMPNARLSGPLAFGHRPPGELGFGSDDARFMAAHGFNAMRLSLSYWEYEPGHFDSGYLDGFRAFAGQLDRAGVYSLLDLQQAIYGPRFAAGEGFPDWMTQTDGFPLFDVGYPNSYYANPAMNRAWDNFWADAPGPDGVGLQEHFASGWRYLARRFAGARGILGYDVLNEPWPGTGWPACAVPSGCPAFDASLQAMYEKLAAAIRAVDRRHLIFYEPNLLYDFGVDTHLPGLGDPRAVLAFHDYCLSVAASAGALNPPGNEKVCGVLEQRPFQLAAAYADRVGDGLFLGEWGGGYSLAAIRRMTAMADENLSGWIYWDSLGLVPDPSAPPRGGNVDRARLEALERPYPQRIAGAPESIDFDPASGRFETRFTTTLPDGRPARRRLTTIYVPQLHYPHGYSVAVTSGRIVSRAGSLVRVRALPGADQVAVRAVPR